jgi:hypothetical protein
MHVNGNKVPEVHPRKSLEEIKCGKCMLQLISKYFIFPSAVKELQIKTYKNVICKRGELKLSH